MTFNFTEMSPLYPFWRGNLKTPPTAVEKGYQATPVVDSYTSGI